MTCEATPAGTYRQPRRITIGREPIGRPMTMSWPVDVDASSGECGPEFVESSEVGFGVGLIRGGDGEYECFDDNECCGVAGEEAWCTATALQGHVDVGFQFAPECVGDQDDGYL